MKQSVLVVGAGFAGATIARVLAEAGYEVNVIDKRSHIGGNAYDELNKQGERVHRYGPHLMHGPNECEAVAFLSRFTEWIPYEHKVRALLPDGRTTPLPVNRTTLEDVFQVELANEDETIRFLESLQKRKEKIQNSDDLFLSNVGEALANLFFRPYTKKMWGRPAHELAVGIGARLPVRTNRDNRYFTDTFQALPAQGYTNLFKALLDHPNIKLSLETGFSQDMEGNYLHCFLCIPIDEYFNYCCGKLPYRSIRFHHHFTHEELQSAAVINFTDSGLYTRKTEWRLLPNSRPSHNNLHQITLEEPCSIEENPGEYYYPVQTEESQTLLKQYQRLASAKSHITFCGRTGLFKYIDMLPAVTLHLKIANTFIKAQQDSNPPRKP